jgi:outer membrane protein TolC
MRRFFIIFIIAYSTSLAEEPVYSLVMCQAKALERSERLSIAELEVGIARERINEIQGIDMPKISAEAAYNVRDKHPSCVRKAPHPVGPQTSPQSQDEKRPSKIKTIVADKHGTTSKVSLVVPIFDFGYVDKLTLVQKSEVQATESERERVEQDVLLAVTASYYMALESAKIESVVLQSIKVLSQQKSISQDLYSVGFVTKNDVLGVQVQLAEREQELIQAQHNIENSLATLNRLTEIDIKGVNELEDCQENIDWSARLDDFLNKVNDNHPDLKTVLAKIQAVEWAYGAIAAENYPDIKGFVNYNTSSDSYLLHKKWLHTGVGIEIPIFDGGIVASKLLQNKGRQKELSLQYEATYQDICLQVKEAFFAVDSAYAKIPVAKQSIIHAEENLKIDRDLYQEGLIASDDLLNDEERLSLARSNYFQALYDFKIAQARLAYAIGEIEI